MRRVGTLLVTKASLRTRCSQVGLRITSERGLGGFVAAYSTSDAADKLHICVVGSGPAGFYTADQLLKRYEDKVHVSLLDRLPTPFGLVRSGVAPDQQDTKNVINQFSQVASDPRVSFLGNVTVGQDVQLRELRQLHHAVVLSYGAESDRRLGIPGEEGPGVLSAREFVWWYNGHPDARGLNLDLRKVRSVAVCGHGNVALDCCRTLLAPPTRFQPTDMATHALGRLQLGTGPREVHLIAGKGPVQAACTPKELKVLLSECGLEAGIAAPDQLDVSEADTEEMKANRPKRRIHELASKAVADSLKRQQQGGAGERRLWFQFYRNPVEVLRGPDGGVTGLRVERTAVRPGPEGGPAVAVGTGEYDTLPCQLVVRSVGYKALPLQGVAFDNRRWVIPNMEGRVLQAVPDASSTAVPPPVDPGLYVVGWLKRPNGGIGTMLLDAEAMVASLVSDTEQLKKAAEVTHGSAGPAGLAGLRSLLSERGVRVVDWGHWRRLDEHEVAVGQAAGRVREKVTDVGDMLRVCGLAAE